MQGKLAIWVIASRKTGKGIKAIFNEARLLNPVKLIETSIELAAALQPGYPPPRLILLDLNLPGGIAWDTLKMLCERRLEFLIIALVDARSEALLDRAYDAGIKTYLRNDFAFADFLERAHVLDLQFVLGHPPN